ncbi:hypothetical protein SAMN05660479_02863 [Microbulbifer thermotolerans]|nr:hypothetical protein SAMN05660479_02863 [Microbulbifer thermotolerans]
MSRTIHLPFFAPQHLVLRHIPIRLLSLARTLPLPNGLLSHPTNTTASTTRAATSILRHQPAPPLNPLLTAPPLSYSVTA